MNLEGYINTVNEIPIINSPAVFGLHPNAEIMYYTNAAKDLWDNMLTLQVQGSHSSSSDNKDEYIDNIASDILSKLPSIWDVFLLRKEAGEVLQPTTVVLF